MLAEIPGALASFNGDFLHVYMIVMFFLLDQKEPKNQGLSPSPTHFDRTPLHKINSPLGRFPR
jgi:hypothetical protein